MALLRVLWVSWVCVVPGWGNRLIFAAGSLWTIPSMPPLFLSEAEKSALLWICCARRGGCDSEGAPAPNVPRPYLNSGLFWLNFHLWPAALSHTFWFKYRSVWWKSDSLWWLGWLLACECLLLGSQATERWSYRSADISASIFTLLESYCSYRLDVSGPFNVQTSLAVVRLKTGMLLLFHIFLKILNRHKSLSNF